MQRMRRNREIAVLMLLAIYVLATSFLPFAWIGFRLGSDLSLYSLLAYVDRINGTNVRVLLLLVYASVFIPWIARNAHARFTRLLPAIFAALVLGQLAHPLPRLLSRWEIGDMGSISLRYGAYLALISAVVLAVLGVLRANTRGDS